MATTNIQVVCRFRPQNSLEKSTDGRECVTIADDKMTVNMNSNQNKHNFTFDHVFGPNSTQAQVYELVGKPVVQDLFQGYNGTIFVYGQTGSGKTYSMMGPNENLTGFCNDKNLKGLIPRVVDSLFESVETSDINLEFTISVQYIEIYMEKIKDLLDTEHINLKIKEDRDSGKGIYIQGAAEEYVTCAEEVFELMRTGAANRVTSSTRMNEESSRSHSIFIITINQKHLINLDMKSGKLFLVDLAGSEKVKKTGAAGKLLEEAKTINKSLSCLGNVINALTDGKSKYVPYRDSKLTRLLQDSLGGNSRTTLMINCSPSTYNEHETLSTLRFGIRAKSIKNKPRVNVELSAKELLKLLDQSKAENDQQKRIIAALETELKLYKTGGQKPSDNSSPVKSIPESSPIVLTLNTRITELEKSLEQEMVDRQKAQDERDTERAERKKVQEERDTLNSKLVAVNSELEAKTEYHTEVENELNSYITDMRTTNSQKTNEINDLRMSLDKVQYESSEKNFTIENLESRVKSIATEFDDAKQEILRLKQDLEKHVTKEKEKKKAQQSVKSFYDFLEHTTEGTDSPTHAKQKKLVHLVDKLKNDLSQIDVEEEHDHEQREKMLKEMQDSIKQSIQASVRETVNISRSQVAATEHLIEDLDARTRELNSSAQANQEKDKLIQELRTELESINIARKEQQDQWETQTMNLMKDLSNRVDKVVELEIALDQVRDQYSQLLNNSENQKYLRRITFLEKSLQQITQSFQEIYSENNKLRIQIKLVESKLELRDKRIESCDRQVQELTRANVDQVADNLERMRQLKKELDAAKMENQKLNKIISTMELQRLSNSYDDDDDDEEDFKYTTHHRIIKPLRGGGVKKPTMLSISQPRPTHAKVPTPTMPKASTPTIQTRQEEDSHHLQVPEQQPSYQHRRRLSLSGVANALGGLLGFGSNTPATPTTGTTPRKRTPSTPTGKISMRELAGGHINTRGKGYSEIDDDFDAQFASAGDDDSILDDIKEQRWKLNSSPSGMKRSPSLGSISMKRSNSYQKLNQNVQVFEDYMK